MYSHVLIFVSGSYPVNVLFLGCTITCVRVNVLTIYISGCVIAMLVVLILCYFVLVFRAFVLESVIHNNYRAIILYSINLF